MEMEGHPQVFAINACTEGVKCHCNWRLDQKNIFCLNRLAVKMSTHEHNNQLSLTISAVFSLKTLQQNTNISFVQQVSNWVNCLNPMTMKKINGLHRIVLYEGRWISWFYMRQKQRLKVCLEHLSYGRFKRSKPTVKKQS